MSVVPSQWPVGLKPAFWLGYVYTQPIDIEGETGVDEWIPVAIGRLYTRSDFYSFHTYFDDFDWRALSTQWRTSLQALLAGETEIATLPLCVEAAQRAGNVADAEFMCVFRVDAGMFAVTAHLAFATREMSLAELLEENTPSQVNTHAENGESFWHRYVGQQAIEDYLRQWDEMGDLFIAPHAGFFASSDWPFEPPG